MAITLIPYDGKPIAKTGAFADVPMSRYHSNLCAGPSISSSGLRTIFNQSPAHYYATSYLNPDAIEREETKALTFGSALHHLTLGQAEFEKHFAVRPDEFDSWRTTKSKEWRDEKVAEGLTVLEPKDIFLIRDMAESLQAHPLIRAGALRGIVEASLIFPHEETGTFLKSRPDCLPTSSADYTDLKSCISVSTRAIERSITDYGYYVQAGLVAMASREVLGMKLSTFSLVFIEKTPPYCVRVVTLKDADLALGERIVEAAVRVFANCVKTGMWPGPGDQNDASYVEINPWERKRIEDRVSLMEQGIFE
jgi:PDDEXK-like domain of unknown function (DUF3799)